jgi:hypothetical protein
VEIGLPQDDAKIDRNSFCNIGRLAEVRFQRSGFVFFDGLGRMLHGLASYFKYEVGDLARK